MLLTQAEIARLAGARERAAHLLDGALASARVFGSATARAAVLTARARLAEAAGEHERARRGHREAVAVARELPLTAELAGAVEGLAGSVLRGDVERAAVLLGAAVALRGTAVTGDPDVARVAASARDLAGADVFAAGYARGAAMTRDQALTTIDTVIGTAIEGTVDTAR